MHRRRNRVPWVAPLLFGSGACALVYQTTWLRELRLIFGASTPASAAVLAIFMGGLGLGSLLLGRRVERHPRPLVFYAQLEILVAGSAALTPFLLRAARALYIALGGALRLGAVGGTLARLLLAAVILAAPTLLMGGTLPAAARAVETGPDLRRRNLAVLYGLNTLGAVLGALLSTFYLLEHCGNRTTLWFACLVNAAVAAAAYAIGRAIFTHDSSLDDDDAAQLDHSDDKSDLPPSRFVLLAAMLSGLFFLLMELVWYRMLGPLLGGSSFTFGLILALALLGIGIGGLLYTLWHESRPATLHGFALTCALMAVGLAVPFAIGDRLALAAAALRSLSILGFVGQVLGWALIAAVVVLPAAIAAGLQFPLLIGLLGRGRTQLGSQVGLAYAWNTIGAIVGSLLGGFGLLPLLSAPGTWRLSVCGLAGLALAAAVLTVRRDASRALRLLIAPGLGIVLALSLIASRGPTAVWRHGGIGSGRADLPEDTTSYNSMRDWAQGTRRAITWEAEGRESSVALSTADGLAFLVSGKSDGSTVDDAPTFLLGGLLGAILHPDPHRALVVGLGTGITAGWLGAVDSLQEVRVVELEPAILQVAQKSALANHDVLANPKVHIVIGDGREVLLTDSQRYDLIVSQPSNPYRAGVASLFTREYYQSAKNRLADGGLFLQWLQAYEVSDQTVRTVYATIADAFPEVETWLTEQGDLLLIASLQPISYDVTRLRARIAMEPYKTALNRIMRLQSLESLLGHYVASNELSRELSRSQRGHRNTDDRTEVEFSFARTAGGSASLDLLPLFELSHARHLDRPRTANGTIDWTQVDARRISMFTLTASAAPTLSYLSTTQKDRAALHSAYLDADLARALPLAHTVEPYDGVELSLITELLVQAHDAAAPEFIARLRAVQPTEADALQGMWLFETRDHAQAAAAFERALQSFQKDPWASRRVMKRVLGALPDLVVQDPSLLERMYTAVSSPFACYTLNEDRLGTLLNLAAALNDYSHCDDAISRLGPNVLWHESFLRWRLACYRHLKQEELALTAERDLAQFLAHKPVQLLQGLRKE